VDGPRRMHRKMRSIYNRLNKKISSEIGKGDLDKRNILSGLKIVKTGLK
jgi:hypothetical protein